jgi:transposase InsO family protein
MNRLAQLCQPAAPAPARHTRHAVAQRPFSQRGLARQRRQRQREQLLRVNAVDFSRWAVQQGFTLGQSATCLRLPARTLRQWDHDRHVKLVSVRALGRPALRSTRQDRNEVIELLDELGPATGLPTLHTCFPAMPRAELDDLLKRYRRLWQLHHTQTQSRLRWLTPGIVWAMDFTEAPYLIDGLYPYLLAVRDLASGQQLLWLPLTSADAENTIRALQPLFLLHGPPLVMKTDNGSPFCAAATQNFFLDWQVIPLFSPAYCPQYNGSIEASIGSLKTRSEQYATQNGRPTLWTYHDAAAALTQANATARPHGPYGPTADDLWNARPKITAEQRVLFQASVNHERDHVRLTEGWPTIGPLKDKDARALDRQAIRRALCGHGYLFIQRRTIPLRFNAKKTANIR